MRNILMFVLLGVFCFGGCTYWYKPNQTFNQAWDSLDECLCQMEARADPGNNGCYEAGYVKDCMKDRGYRLVFEHQLPDDVKRQDPSLNRFWVRAGVAGKLDEPVICE